MPPFSFKLICSFCLGLLCALVDDSSAYAESKFDSDIELYQHARTLGLTESLPLFDKLVTKNPRTYIGERAKMFAQNGNLARALEDFNEAVRLDPNMWLSARASFLYSSGEISQADADWRTLIELRKDKLAQVAPGTKEFSRLSSDLARAYFTRGKAFGSDSNEALIDFKNAATWDLGFAEYYLDQCENLNIHSDCLQLMNRLVEKNPERYLTRRAEYFENQKQLDLAIQDYDEAVKMSRKLSLDDGYSPRAWAYIRRSIYYRSIGEKKCADEDMKKAMRLERLQKTVCGFSSYPVH